MRKTVFIMACLAGCLYSFAQDFSDMISVYRNDGEFSAFIRSEVDSITFSISDEGTTQLVYTKDSVYAIPVSSVISVNFDNDTGMHPHMVDLGLPSGTKWASCNIGASKPEEYGKYYAWAMTEEMESYDPYSYIYYDTEAGWSNQMGKVICGTEYDVAHVRWGGKWELPSLQQSKELVDNCETEWTNVNGVDGGLFTGPNGNSIFLPAAGYYFADYKKGEGELGRCWTGTHYIYYQGSAFAYSLTVVDGGASPAITIQYFVGLPVRPVCK